MTRNVIGNVVSLFGGLLVFMSWVIQRTFLDRANRILDDISSAYSAFQAYQSNNAVMNAIKETSDDRAGQGRGLRWVVHHRSARSAEPEPQTTNIVRFQVYNYELGLTEMERVLDKAAREDLPPAVDIQGEAPTTLLERIQPRLEKIQAAVHAKKQSVIERKARINRLFLGVYIVGSIAVLAGAIIRDWDGVRSATTGC